MRKLESWGYPVKTPWS